MDRQIEKRQVYRCADKNKKKDIKIDRMKERECVSMREKGERQIKGEGEKGEEMR